MKVPDSSLIEAEKIPELGRWEKQLREFDQFGQELERSKQTQEAIRVGALKNKEWIWQYENEKTILVDLWDYGKTGPKEAFKAIDALQAFWRYCCLCHEDDEDSILPNIVVFLQKESIPLHFFLGKMEYRELKPWAPAILAEYLEFAFGSSGPFTKEALIEIACLARGIFRKFKEYIAACIEAGPMTDERKNTISIDDVKRVITSERVVQDSDLRLAEYWPRSKKLRNLSVKVLQFLRENGPTLQEVLGEKFFLDDSMGCSRLLNTLEIHGEIKHEQVGKKRRWSIT